jgi:GGDEF domain-containing protein
MINDKYGHDKGDIAIKNLAALIRRVFIHSPVYRIGGDEFVVLLDAEVLAMRESLIGRFRDEVRALSQIENRKVGTDVWDEYPTYEEWISQFDMDTDTPDMAKLESAHEGHLPVWSEGNVYFNGAGAYRAERNGKADAQHTVDA